MEESMIVGALETLNEEALEDTLEENNQRKPSNPSVIVGNPLSPILSDTEELISEEKTSIEKRMPIVATTPSEIDALYLCSLQNSPTLRVSALSLSDSMTDLESSSFGRLPYISTALKNSTLSLTRTKSEDNDSASPTSSPSRKRGPKLKSSSIQRPSSLVYDTVSYFHPATGNKSEVCVVQKSDPNLEISRKTSEKNIAFNHVANKVKQFRKRSVSKSESSDSSTETEEKVRPKNYPSTVPTPGSDADGFFSDDEHTPLVSPFHISRSSHYNLQSSKLEKESTPEKSIPKHCKSDSGPHRKIKNQLERQFSIDSNLCDHSRPPPSSTSMVEISTPLSTTHYVPILPSYGQDVTDSPLIEDNTISMLESQIHNETIL